MSKVHRFKPKVLENNDTTNSIYDVQMNELNKVDSDIMRIFHNNFVESSDIVGVQKYEKILEIKSDVQFDLDYRKKKIYDRLNYKPPFTRQRLMSILKNIWGEGNFTFEIKPKEFEGIMEVDTDNAPYYIYYSNVIRGIIPANMYLIISLPYTYTYMGKQYTYEKMEKYDYEELSRYA